MLKPPLIMGTGLCTGSVFVMTNDLPDSVKRVIGMSLQSSKQSPDLQGSVMKPPKTEAGRMNNCSRVAVRAMRASWTNNHIKPKKAALHSCGMQSLFVPIYTQTESLKDFWILHSNSWHV